MAAIQYASLLSNGCALIILHILMASAEGTTRTTTLNYYIRSTWDGDSVTHSPIKVSLEGPVDEGIELAIEAPFFNDSDVPPGTAGEPVWKLWEYEVVEAFFLGDNDNYLEVEVSPHGHHIVLLLKGVRNAINFCLPLSVKTTINKDKGTWNGVAFIPAAYFPVNVSKFNAFAIHGKEPTRTYLQLNPEPKGKHPAVDFHRLENFQTIAFERLLPSNPTSSLSELWSVQKDPEKGC